MKYNSAVMQAVRQYKGLESNDTSRDDEIENESTYAVLDMYLSWEGIYGYTDVIMSIVNANGSVEE